MTFDAPKSYNLSQEDDIAKLKKDLTPEEQQALDEYLESEKQAIIYLTEQELGELKRILSEDISQSHDADFDEFITGQQQEGLAASDLLPETQGNILSPELLDSFDSISHETLFGKEGIFSGLDISDTAKDHVAVSLSLALIENIKSDSSKLVSMIEDLKAGNIDTASSLVSQYNENFAGLGDILSGFEGISGETLISGQGEQNTLFMNTETGKEFFSGILSGKIGEHNITAEIQKYNSDIPLEASLGDITEISSILSLTEQELQSIVVSSEGVGEGTGDTGAGDTPVGTPPETTPEEAQSAIDALKEQTPFGPFLAALLQALQGIVDFGKNISGAIEGDGSGTTPEGENTGGEDTPEAQESVSNMVELLESFDADSSFESGQINTLIEELRGNPSLAQRMQSLLEGISPDETFIESFNDLGLTEKGTNIGDTFREYGLDTSLPEGISQGERVIKYIEEYARYRNSEGVRGLTSDRTTWEEYARQRQAENWSTGGR